jgi:hypothetical protein
MIITKAGSSGGGGGGGPYLRYAVYTGAGNQSWTPSISGSIIMAGLLQTDSDDPLDSCYIRLGANNLITVTVGESDTSKTWKVGVLASNIAPVALGA